MSDVLRLAGMVSLFLGSTMFFFTFMGEKEPKQFMLQFIFSPMLIYLGLKLLL